MYVVDGFEFQTKEEARQAKKESDGIRYIKDQTDMSDPDTVYKLYLRLNKPGYFFTPVVPLYILLPTPALSSHGHKYLKPFGTWKVKAASQALQM